jgi:hypothetical protein
VYLKNSEPLILGIISKIKYVYGRTYLPTQRTRRKRAEKENKNKKKTPGINPRQPAGKGRGKKTLVLTLGSPPDKGGKKKPWY